MKIMWDHPSEWLIRAGGRAMIPCHSGLSRGSPPGRTDAAQPGGVLRFGAVWSYGDMVRLLAVEPVSQKVA